MKKALAIALSVLFMIPAMGVFPVTAADTTKILYENNFDDGDYGATDVSTPADEETGKSASEINSEKGNTSVNGSKAVSIRRKKGSEPAARIKFAEALELSNLTDNNMMVETDFDAHVTGASTDMTSKTITSQYMLATAAADFTTGQFGGIKFTGGSKVTTWKISFVAADGAETILVTGIEDAEFITAMKHFKVQYVFRENGKAKNVARVWVGEVGQPGTSYGGDIELNVQKVADLSNIGSFLIKPALNSANPKAWFDNATVRLITNNEASVDPDPTASPDVTPDPDQSPAPTAYPELEPLNVSPQPTDAAGTPDLAAKAGILLQNRFESSETVEKLGWQSKNKGGVLQEGYAAAETGKAITVTGNGSSEIGAFINFAKTYTLTNGDQAQTPPELDALQQEGEGCTVVTEFDIMSKDINELNQNVDIFLQKSVNNSNTPITRMVLNGETGTIQMTYNVPGQPASSSPKEFPVKYSFVDGKWYRIRLTFHVTGTTTEEESASDLKSMSVSINGEQVLERMNFGSSSSGKTGFYDEFRIRAKQVQGTVAVDNLSVYKYNNESAAVGVGVPVDRSKLISLVREAQAQLATTSPGTADDQYPMELRSALTAAAVSAVNLYRDTSATQEQVNTGTAGMQAALEQYVPNGQKLQVLAPEFFREDGTTPMSDLSQSDVLKTKIQVVSGAKQPEFETATLIVALYKGSPQNKTLLQVVSSEEVPLAAGQTQDLTVDLNLKEYPIQDRSGMFVQLMVWDSMNGLKPILGCVSTL